MNELIEKCAAISIEAGRAVMDVYNREFSVEIKDDKSPLTEADKASHNIICDKLEEAFTYPVLSEESRDISFEERKHWDIFWLVDPLDGTKEFIKRNGEFTVNIALIKNGKPVKGFVYAPVPDILYIGDENLGAFQLANAANLINEKSGIAGKTESITCSNAPENRNLRVVASKSHCNDSTREFICLLEKQYGKAELVSKGSSLKLCMVADSSADVYPRIAPTMEWDTAAAQAVVEAAGGIVVEYETRNPLRYNKENLLNPYFIVSSPNTKLP